MHLKERLCAMILMFLGSLTLSLYGWQQAFRGARKVLYPAQKTFLEQKSSLLIALLARNKILSMLSLSALENSHTAILMWNLGLKSRRESVLRFCLSPLGNIGFLLVASLYLSFNGYLFLGFAFFGFFAIFKRVQPAFWTSLIGLGIFLVGAELSLRQSTLLLNLLGTSEVAFFLADGRFLSVFLLLIASLTFSFILRLEMWSLVLCLGLLVANVISLNGALGVVTGEILASALAWIWHSRALPTTQRSVVLRLSVSSAVGALLGFWVAGQTRIYFDLGFGVNFANYQERLLIFILLISVVVFVQMLVLMPVGHFVAKDLNEPNLETVKYIPASWRLDLSPGVDRWTAGRVQQRLSEIRYHIQGLQSLPSGKIPQALQSRLLTEEKQLSEFLQTPG